jgi:hypothetical protein
LNRSCESNAAERPDGEFWDSFEHSFERRRLNALVERESSRITLMAPLVKMASYAFPVFLVAGLAFLWSESQRTESLPSERMGTITSIDTPTPPQSGSEPVRLSEETLPILAMNEGQHSSQFVVDAIEDTSRNGLNFRKVLYTPAIHLSAPSGSFYVKDSFSSRNYKVTTADVKLGRNF